MKPICVRSGEGDRAPHVARWFIGKAPLDTERKICGGYLLPRFVVELSSEREDALILAIVVVDPLQLVEAIDVIPALQPAFSRFEMDHVAERYHRLGYRNHLLKEQLRNGFA